MPDDWSADTWQPYDVLHTDDSDFTFQTTLDGTIVWMSPDLLGLSGLSTTSWRGQPTEVLMHPLDADRVADSRAVMVRGATFDETTVRVRTISDGYRTLAMRTRCVHDRMGSFQGLLITLHDLVRHSASLRALTTLSNATRILLRASDREAMLQELMESIVDTGDYTLAWYGQALHDEHKSVVAAAKAGPHLPYLAEIDVTWGDDPLGQGPCGKAIRTGESQVINLLSDDPRFRPWRETAEKHGMGAAAGLPVVVNGVVDGVLMVYADENGAFDALALGLFEELASDLGFALERISA